MPTLYTRNFNFKDSLSDEEVLTEWRFLIEDAIPAVEKIDGAQVGI